MAGGDPRTAVASAARTANGNSGAVGLADKGEFLNLLVNVTAASGTTPSLALTLSWSHDGVNFFAADPAESAFTPITAVAGAVKQFAVKGPFFQVNWAITGTTPSFTFSISAYTSGAA